MIVIRTKNEDGIGLEFVYIHGRFGVHRCFKI